MLVFGAVVCLMNPSYLVGAQPSFLLLIFEIWFILAAHFAHH